MSIPHVANGQWKFHCQTSTAIATFVAVTIDTNLKSTVIVGGQIDPGIRISLSLYLA